MINASVHWFVALVFVVLIVSLPFPRCNAIIRICRLFSAGVFVMNASLRFFVVSIPRNFVATTLRVAVMMKWGVVLPIRACNSRVLV